MFPAVIKAEVSLRTRLDGSEDVRLNFPEGFQMCSDCKQLSVNHYRRDVSRVGSCFSHVLMKIVCVVSSVAHPGLSPQL